MILMFKKIKTICIEKAATGWQTNIQHSNLLGFSNFQTALKIAHLNVSGLKIGNVYFVSRIFSLNFFLYNWQGRVMQRVYWISMTSAYPRYVVRVCERLGMRQMLHSYRQSRVQNSKRTFFFNFPFVS